MKQQKKTTKQNGITLISLVITIVIMLILAGVAISIAVGDGSVTQHAENATEKWNNRVAEENIIMQNVLAQLDKIPSGTTPPETPAEVSITLNTANGEVNSGLELEEDATLVLTASLNVIATQDIVWSSSDDTIATVGGSGINNSTGTITGVSVGGPVTITATYGDKTTTCSVTVTEKPIELVTFFIGGELYQMPVEYVFSDWVGDPKYNLVGAYLDERDRVRRASDDAYLMDDHPNGYAIYGNDPGLSDWRYKWGTNPVFVDP